MSVKKWVTVDGNFPNGYCTLLANGKVEVYIRNNSLQGYYKAEWTLDNLELLGETLTDFVRKSREAIKGKL